MGRELKRGKKRVVVGWFGGTTVVRYPLDAARNWGASISPGGHALARDGARLLDQLMPILLWPRGGLVKAALQSFPDDWGQGFSG